MTEITPLVDDQVGDHVNDSGQGPTSNQERHPGSPLLQFLHQHRITMLAAIVALVPASIVLAQETSEERMNKLMGGGNNRPAPTAPAPTGPGSAPPAGSAPPPPDPDLIPDGGFRFDEGETYGDWGTPSEVGDINDAIEDVSGTTQDDIDDALGEGRESLDDIIDGWLSEVDRDDSSEMARLRANIAKALEGEDLGWGSGQAKKIAADLEGARDDASRVIKGFAGAGIEGIDLDGIDDDPRIERALKALHEIPDETTDLSDEEVSEIQAKVGEAIRDLDSYMKDVISRLAPGGALKKGFGKLIDNPAGTATNFVMGQVWAIIWRIGLAAGGVFLSAGIFALTALSPVVPIFCETISAVFPNLPITASLTPSTPAGWIGKATGRASTFDVIGTLVSSISLGLSSFGISSSLSITTFVLSSASITSIYASICAANLSINCQNVSFSYWCPRSVRTFAKKTFICWRVGVPSGIFAAAYAAFQGKS